MSIFSSYARLASKPHYVFHPARAVRRALYGASGAADDTRLHVAELPWGLPLGVYRSDAVGFSILTGGVFDPCVTETLHRLIDPGERVIDVGANVGYLTSLAAVRSGSSGVVIAYEPHPAVFDLLSSNVARWKGYPGLARIETHQLALSDYHGSGSLVTGPGFNQNMALASLSAESEGRADGEQRHGSETVTVAVERLDDVIGSEPVGLLKIDVEGFEAQVLRGSQSLLGGAQVRDIVFEDHDPYPTPATELVEQAGYELLSLDNNLFGLTLTPPADRVVSSPWPGPSYLATREPGRARDRLGASGWQVDGIGLGLGGRLGRRRPAR